MVCSTISHYPITEKLGEGGWVRFTKQERIITLKFLAASLPSICDEQARQPHDSLTNRYPTPRTVSKWRGREGSFSR